MNVRSSSRNFTGRVAVAGALLLGFTLGFAAVAAAEIKEMPQPAGIKLGMSTAEVEKLLKTLGSTDSSPKVTTGKTPSGRDFERTRIRASLKGAPGLDGVKLDLYNRRLARIRIYGPRVDVTMAAQLGRADFSVPDRQVWLDPGTFRLVICSPRHCELQDMGIVGSVGIASPDELKKEYARMVSQLQRPVAPPAIAAPPIAPSAP